jgi:hypothetical protein
MILKRYSILGLFLVTMLPATARAAACPPGGAAEMAELTPISSHYTKKVIERAEAGISAANAGSESPLDLDFLFLDWLDEITGFIAEVIDTDLRLNQEQLDLRQHTACLYIDLEIIEATMTKVQCLLGEETLTTTSVNVEKIFKLHSVLMFLNERYRHLLAGGSDPLYRDGSWQIQQDFDARDYTKDPPMCPFHSDYLPPTVYGYGCDTETLGNYSFTPVQEENDALEQLIEERNEFIEDSQDLDELILQLNWFTGREPPDLSNFGAGLDREHKEFSGCAAASTGTGTIEAGHEVYRRGGTRVELRGPFSFEKDEPKIVREFLQLRTLWGASRPQSKEFKFPSEFTNPAQRLAAETRELSFTFLDKAIRNVGRLFMHAWNMEQSKREAGIVAKASDPFLQTRQELQELRTQMAWLAQLANQKNMGGRLFTAKLGTFLRASCIDRPCNTQLENVLKVILTDDCFPFVPGDFARMTEEGDDPDAKCVQSARL